MDRFSPQLMCCFPNAHFEQVEKLLGRAEAARLSANRAEDVSPVAKIPFKVRDLLQVGLRRNTELSTAFIHAFNGELFIPLFVLGRASIETACLISDFSGQAIQITAEREKTALDKFDQSIVTTSLGARSKTWSCLAEQYPMPNVLTNISHLEKAGCSGLRESYDLLCEYAHPNYLGMTGAYCQIDEQARETHYVNLPMKVECARVRAAVNALELALLMSVYAVEEFECKLSDFTLLCEEDIHDKGAWPMNIEYPIARESNRRHAFE